MWDTRPRVSNHGAGEGAYATPPGPALKRLSQQLLMSHWLTRKSWKIWWHRLSSLCLNTRGRVSSSYGRTFQGSLILCLDA